MRNTISCSANKLDLLTPTMVQGVVDASTFELGSRYLRENRVRIVEADGVFIRAAVLGLSGLHEQTLQLSDGQLIADCSCHLTEQPVCRHSVGVLLEYVTWMKAREKRRASREGRRESQEKAPVQSSPGESTYLRDITVFVDWIQRACAAFEGQEPLPELSHVHSAHVEAWADAIREMVAHGRHLRAELLASKAEVDAREIRIAQLTERLQGAGEELSASRLDAQRLQLQLQEAQAKLGEIAELAKGLHRFISEAQALSEALAQHGSQLSSLSGLLGQSSMELKRLSEPPSR